MTGRRLRDMTAADWMTVERNAYARDEARYEAEQARAEEWAGLADDPYADCADDPWAAA